MKLALVLSFITTMGCIWGVACSDSGESGFSSSDSDSDSDGDGDGDGDGDNDRAEVDTSIFPDIPDDNELIMGNCATGPCVVNVADCVALGGVTDNQYRCVSGICCNTEGVEDSEGGGVDTDLFPDIPPDNDFQNGTCSTGPCVVNTADCMALGGLVDNRYTCTSGVCCNTSDSRSTDTGTGVDTGADTGADSETALLPVESETDTADDSCRHKCTSGPIECSITLEGTMVSGLCPDNGVCCDLGAGDTEPDAGDGGSAEAY